MKQAKVSTFFISSTDDKGAVRKLTLKTRTLSVEVVDKLAHIESSIPTIRSRARTLWETVRNFRSMAERDGKTFDEFVAERMKGAPIAESLCIINAGDYTLSDIEESLANDAASVTRECFRQRIEILRTVANRNDMSPADLALLDSPFDPKAIVEAKEEKGEKTTTVVDVDNSFWQNADADELEEASDFFRKRVKG